MAMLLVSSLSPYLIPSSILLSCIDYTLLPSTVTVYRSLIAHCLEFIVANPGMLDNLSPLRTCKFPLRHIRMINIFIIIVGPGSGEKVSVIMLNMSLLLRVEVK
jgi:hypothetical protein